jgi:hypothetical protein
MNVLDENILKDQGELLLGWRVRIRQIGYDIGRKGVTDEEIIPLLLQSRRPTFFTLDFDFYKQDLCHARYYLVCMAVRQDEAAAFARRLLRHKEFNAQAKRMGKVIRLSPVALSVWELRTEEEIHYDW